MAAAAEARASSRHAAAAAARCSKPARSAHQRARAISSLPRPACRMAASTFSSCRCRSCTICRGRKAGEGAAAGGKRSAVLSSKNGESRPAPWAHHRPPAQVRRCCLDLWPTPGIVGIVGFHTESRLPHLLPRGGVVQRAAAIGAGRRARGEQGREGHGSGVQGSHHVGMHPAHAEAAHACRRGQGRHEQGRRGGQGGGKEVMGKAGMGRRVHRAAQCVRSKHRASMHQQQ